MKLEIVKQVKVSISLTFLHQIVSNISNKFKPAHQLVSLAFVSPREIRKLNKVYRGRDKATDVLSFSYSSESLLGEVIICHDIARRYAKQDGTILKQEVSKLFVHGLLHLLGYNHHTEAQSAKMKKEESYWLDQI